MKDILLVEDQEELAELIQIFLEKEGFTVLLAGTGEQAVEYLKEQQVKLLLLDIMLPEMDGFAVCRAVREKGNMPVLIMSARAGRDDKLTGYELGADDYMEKPVDPEILTAKVRALMQRAYGTFAESDILSSGGITIDTVSRKGYLNGKELDLNGKEYELLLLFLKNPGKTLLKDYIFAQIWGMDSLSENQTLTVHIKMLRKKIEENPREPKRIVTVWGVGYRYEEV
ncbi:DNA-binding response regulator [Clostridium sp. AF19-22AC]|jgi:DNA-binding response OmpR family regulator|uniref:Stage 0 sporulation protein A homolog n=1 Tax=Faecalicatena orotica TaxID=1544 RepID=A0A2Y9BAT1_9FIRM|nr:MULTISPECIES: response regulator transcription factor [Clostridia]PWJ30838.1 DNA-binding response OmpR family regulator [Faecalicatena orotica]RHR29601.1 DNA-binding response regulator [Clostridium sp. AF19-22AC]SSA54999.1 DNA-binding response regulator, OmpR family, contains REC and winged-helix (wHTH) domain [Faecalicatena orotica]